MYTYMYGCMIISEFPDAHLIIQYYAKNNRIKEDYYNIFNVLKIYHLFLLNLFY